MLDYAPRGFGGQFAPLDHVLDQAVIGYIKNVHFRQMNFA